MQVTIDSGALEEILETAHNCIIYSSEDKGLVCQCCQSLLDDDEAGHSEGCLIKLILTSVKQKQ